jgi:hypothetical protein
MRAKAKRKYGRDNHSTHDGEKRRMDESKQYPEDSTKHGDYGPSEMILARPMQWIHFVAMIR